MEELKIGDIVLIIGPKDINPKETTMYLGNYCWLGKMYNYIGKVSCISSKDNISNCFNLHGYYAYFHKDWLLKIG